MNIREIERAIAQLPREDFFELVRRLRERHVDEWDWEIDEDAKDHRLDRLRKKPEKEIEAGGLRPLDEILEDPGPS